MPKHLISPDSPLLGIAEPVVMLPLILAAAVLLAIVGALLATLQLGRALLPVHSPPPLRSRPALPGGATDTPSISNR